MGEIIILLTEKVQSDNDHIRAGACLGLSQIMTSATKLQLDPHVTDIIVIIRKGLVDSFSEVREASAQCFDVLHSNIGGRAIDEVIPYLLTHLSSAQKSGMSSENNVALEALKEILSRRGTSVLPLLLSSLLVEPITSFNARALTSLISVAGPAVHRKMSSILEALMRGLDQDPIIVADIEDSLRALVTTVDDEDGVHSIMLFLLENVKQHCPAVRQRASCSMLASLCDNNDDADATAYIDDWIRILISFFKNNEDHDADLEKAAWKALGSLVLQVDKDDLSDYTHTAYMALASLVDDESSESLQNISAFNRTKGMTPLLSIFLAGFLNGDSELREEASEGIALLLQMTEAQYLKPFVIHIAGQLIRIAGEKVSNEVKSLTIKNLDILLRKVAPMMKPFMPQLQRTFVKALVDSSRNVRSQAAIAFSTFVGLQSNIDALVRELERGLTGADVTFDQSIVNELCGVLKKWQPDAALSEPVCRVFDKLIESGKLNFSQDEEMRQAAASLVEVYRKRKS